MKVPSYKYKARDIDGKKRKGLLEAPNEDELYNKLKLEGLYLEKAVLADGQRAKKKLKTKALSEFCRQLGTLLGAGVSLVRALSIISQEESLRPYEKMIYEDVLRLIRQGISLSDAMEQQNGAFPDLLINMIKAAQESGSMDKTAMRMAVHYEKDYKLNGKLKNAMIYPCILLVLIVLVVIFIVSFVIPQFSDLFSQMEELPLPTRVVLGVSDAFQYYWYFILAGVAVVVLVIKGIFSIPKVHIWKDKMKLRLPVFGKLYKVIYTARFARTLSSLYSAGLPIVLALQVGRKTVGNSYMDQQFDEVIAQVRAGGNLSAALKTVDGFVNKLSSTIMIGEETGSLDSMLDSISDTLDYESEIAISKMVTMLEPVLIVVMAVIVGFIMIAVMLPIYDSYSAIETSAYI